MCESSRGTCPSLRVTSGPDRVQSYPSESSPSDETHLRVHQVSTGDVPPEIDLTHPGEGGRRTSETDVPPHSLPGGRGGPSSIPTPDGRRLPRTCRPKRVVYFCLSRVSQREDQFDSYTSTSPSCLV